MGDGHEPAVAEFGLQKLRLQYPNQLFSQMLIRYRMTYKYPFAFGLPIRYKISWRSGLKGVASINATKTAARAPALEPLSASR
jgi:hypothetical protein